MRRFLLRALLMLGVTVAVSAGAGTVALAAKPASKGHASYTPYGDYSLVSPGYKSNQAMQLRSVDSTDYGYVSFGIASDLTIARLTRLATYFEFPLDSGCWGGSPRFDVGVQDPSAGAVEIHFLIGPPPSYTGCELGTWVSSGNLASASSPVDDSELPGGGPAVPYSTIQSNFGTDPVTSVELVVDGGWSASQTAQFDDTHVNSERFTYEG